MAYVQSDRTGNSVGAATTIVAPAMSVSTGNSLLVVIRDFTNTVGTVTDTAGNTYTEALEFLSSAADCLSFWYCHNITGHASNVVTGTFVGFGSFRSIHVYEFTGIGGAPYSTSQKAAPGNSTSVTTDAWNAPTGLVFGAAQINGASVTTTWGNGFTESEDDTVLSTAYKIYGSALAGETVGVTFSTSGSPSIGIMAFGDGSSTEEIITGGLSDSGALGRIQLIQYTAVSGPVYLTPVVTVPDTVAVQPQFQLSTQRRPATGAAWVPQHSNAEGQYMDWLSKFPDRIYRWSLRTAAQLDFVTPSPLTIQDTTIKWLGSYDNLVWRKLMHPSRMPFEVNVSSARPIGKMEWQPEYPDYIPRMYVRTWYHEGVFSPRREPVFTDLRWDARYPNWIDPKRGLHASLQRDLFRDVVVIGQESPALAWNAKYPDRIARQRTHPARMQSHSWNTQILLAGGAVSFSFPDEIYGKKGIHASRAPFIFGQHHFPFVDTSWFNYAPVKVDRKRYAPVPDYWGDGREGISNLPSPPLAWKSVYPDYLGRKSAHATRNHYFGDRLFTFYDSLDPRFLGVYPERVNRTQMRAGSIPFFWHNLDPIVNPPVVELSWSPFYPATARGRALPTALLPQPVGNNLTDWTFRQWYPRYADMVPGRKQARLQASVGALEPIYPPIVTLVPMDGLMPVLRQRRPLAGTFEAPISIISATAYGHTWDPEYPDYLHWRQTTQKYLQDSYVLRYISAITAGTIDCIEIEDIGTTYPMYVRTYMTHAKFVNQSLTYGDHTVEFC